MARVYLYQALLPSIPNEHSAQGMEESMLSCRAQRCRQR